ncbi:hypothetical protein [Gracilimonas halophila]|uniref:Uncharacterized protein n=1 Tax=Gracilimonas halophila TaxID=1834464 RepID=A0ABW5JH73_9BACT
MNNNLDAFKEPIESGLVRILIRVQGIQCEVKNDAPDFIDPKGDEPNIKIVPEADVYHLTQVFQSSYPLVLNKRKSKDGILVWDLEQEGIWFDIPMDKVKEVWLTDFNFYIESNYPRYLTYYILDVDHKIQWLQVDESGSIISLSEFRKKFTPPPLSEKATFTGTEILKCSDMLGRATRKIDVRTGKAMVKFNTEKGRLEPLLMGMAEKLGYVIEPLDKPTIIKEDEVGNSVSHTISLK